MTGFQCLAVGLLACALAAEAAGAAWRRFSVSRLVRGLTWASALVAILFPGLIQGVAYGLGIRRGTDLLLYVFVLTSLFTSFSFYSRLKAVQHQVTELIRREAIEHARHGPRAAGDGPPGGVAGDDPPRARHPAARPATNLGRDRGPVISEGTGRRVEPSP